MDGALGGPLVAFAQELAGLARTETLPRFRQDLHVTDKGGGAFDPVTEGDREAERVMRRAIEVRWPDHGIIGEEHGQLRPEARWRWVLDPIDGTRAYVCGVPSWTTLIGLEEHGSPVVGVVDQPFLGERWVGGADGTLYIRGGEAVRARTSGRTRLETARVSTTDPRAGGAFTHAEAEAFDAVARRTPLQRFSMDAYGYGLLALGTLDLVIESTLKHYDYAALVPVVRGAGGVITDWDGGLPGSDPRGRIVAAANPALHAAALEHLRGCP
jgi:histidinol phosphatase-like enzyme (inositol monophosphatase family)